MMENNNETKFLTYGAVIEYNSYSPRAGAEVTRTGIVISEINNRNFDENSKLNIVLVGHNTTSRYDTQLSVDSYARSGFGFTQISVNQITSVTDVIPRYEAEEIHIRSLRATLGGVSTYKADELFYRAFQGYLPELERMSVEPEPAETPSVPSVEPQDLRTTEDPLIKRSLTVPAVEEEKDPLSDPIIETTAVTPIDAAPVVVESVETSEPANPAEAETTKPKRRQGHIDADSGEFVRILFEVESVINDSEITDIDTLINRLDEIALNHNYKNYVSMARSFGGRTKSNREAKTYHKVWEELTKKKHHLRYIKSQMVKAVEEIDSTTVEPEEHTEADPVTETKADLEPTPYEIAKLTFRKTCKAKNLDLVRGLGDVKAVLNDLYHAPDLSEFAKKYRYKKNREKLINKIKSLCFSHGLTYEKEIEYINENRAKVGLDNIITL